MRWSAWCCCTWICTRGWSPSVAADVLGRYRDRLSRLRHAVTETEASFDEAAPSPRCRPRTSWSAILPPWQPAGGGEAP